MLDNTTPIALEQMSLKELKELNTRVTKAISQFDERRKREALQAIDAAAREHGFTLAELMGEPLVKTRRAAVAKYANPDDASMTWTGRGRKPLWATAALDSGKSLEDLLIRT